MRELYFLSVTVHVMAAVFWLGGMFFFAAVGAPVLREIEPATLRADLFRRLGERFRGSGWTALALLVVTGTANLWFGGVLRRDTLANPDFWSSSYGRALGWKLAAVGSMIAVSALHDFVLGPAATKSAPGSRMSTAARRRAALVARANAVLGLIVVIVAVRLARGG